MARSPMLQILAGADMEGFTTSFVVPSQTSGATIGAGIDMSKTTPQALLKAGVDKNTVYKVAQMGLYGKLGHAATLQVAKIPPGLMLTPQEVEAVSEAMVQHAQGQLKTIVPNWDTLPDGVKVIAMSAAHQYGLKGFQGQNLFNQVVNKDYPRMARNLGNWGDKTPGVSDSINNRYKRLGKYVPATQTILTGP